jgi:hypothetical protein
LAWHIARLCEKRTAYRILVGKPKGKTPLIRFRCSWLNNITLIITEIEWGGMD